jgi:hypothetical protein
MPTRQARQRMREAQLRTVLLVKAIEETDGTERLIPEAERKAATREAARNTGDATTADASHPGAQLSRRAQRMLAERAELLLEPVRNDHRFVDSVLRMAGGSASLGWLLILLSALLGGALSAIDGRRIDILSRPLLGLIAWNLLVYAAVIASSIRSHIRRRPRRSILRAFIAERVLRRVRRAVSGSARYNAALAKALDGFVSEWAEVARPLLLARAARLFHLCAAAAGGGLIAVLYLRGLTIDYSAGWESTLLDADRVHAFISIVYGPASALTGIPIPDVSRLDTIRWEGDTGGERAAYWIHLLAASVVVYIVAPRLVLAAIGTLAVWARTLNMALPPGLAAYFGRTFGEGHAAGLHAVTVVPYAYEPADAILAQLSARLRAALGEGVIVNNLPAVRYGDEETLLRDVDRVGDGEVLALLVNLAATPEEENHGAAIGRLHARLSGRTSGKALILIDESAYAARMQALGGAAERMNERRRLWKAFVERHDSLACFVNLAADGDRQPAETSSDSERLKEALLQL